MGSGLAQLKQALCQNQWSFAINFKLEQRSDINMAGRTVVIGNKVLINKELVPATIVVENGKIVQIVEGKNVDPAIFFDSDHIVAAGQNVLMPGIFDSHVHVNEPGRTEWEGFFTATKAAAAGGVTTLIDMPLNSIPPTTTLENAKIKMAVAEGKCHIDVGFWGGVVPENEHELLPLVDHGVIGFKCFLIHSGVDEFPCVDEAQVDKALSKLKGSQSVLAFHAEVETTNEAGEDNQDPGEYQCFLESRPPQMEHDAIELVAKMCRKHGNVRCHIVHLSAAGALPTIAKLKAEGYPLTVETCPHYLSLQAELISPKETQFKCCPPIRDAKNQDLLWEGLLNGLIDMIVSDHSPCTAELKQPGLKDFMSAWGGISSVQFGLSVIWTEAKRRGFEIHDISRLMTENPSKLAGMNSFKGKIAVGYDADFVIWNPEAEVEINETSIQHRNKLTPYKGKRLFGKVLKTIVRGRIVFDQGHFAEPLGMAVRPPRS